LRFGVIFFNSLINFYYLNLLYSFVGCQTDSTNIGSNPIARPIGLKHISGFLTCNSIILAKVINFKIMNNKYKEQKSNYILPVWAVSTIRKLHTEWEIMAWRYTLPTIRVHRFLGFKCIYNKESNHIFITNTISKHVCYRTF